MNVVRSSSRWPSLCLVLTLLAAAGLARAAGPAWNGEAFTQRLQPVPKQSGFKMPGYWLWDGSVIKVGDTYHLFASRWPKGKPFPVDYRRHSEIVRAESKDPLGPYEFKEVVIGRRDPAYWDSTMAHNPTIHRIGDTYVLFYIGSDDHTIGPDGRNPLRRVGYATAKSITGPWTRSDQPIIAQESDNPAVYVEADGSVKLLYRDAPLRMYLAVARDFRGPYTIANDQVWAKDKLEDFDLFKAGGKYHMIAEDNVGGVTGHDRWGALLESDDGITGWKPASAAAAYDHDIPYTDGSVLKCVRRERPQLLIQDGAITHLFTSVYDGQDTWCQPVALSPPLPL
jgi:hypothetical protein